MVIRRRRARRDAETAARVEHWLNTAHANGHSAVHVVRVYQAARRGTKAVVQLHGTGWARDAWFWWTRVSAGQLLVVDAVEGWGPHTGRTDVFYIGHQDGRPGDGIHLVVPTGDVQRWLRHRRRSA